MRTYLLTMTILFINFILAKNIAMMYYKPFLILSSSVLGLYIACVVLNWADKRLEKFKKYR
jgi:hypothetical protein